MPPDKDEVEEDEGGDLVWKRSGQCGSKGKEKIDSTDKLVKAYVTLIADKKFIGNAM